MSLSDSEISVELKKLCDYKEFNKYNSFVLEEIELYFSQQLVVEDARIRKLELLFFNSLEKYIKSESEKSNSFFAFLTKRNHKINFEIAKRIHTLYRTRIFLIRNEFDKDIRHIEWFVDLAKSKFKKFELFIFFPNYKDSVWEKKSFAKSAFNYLCFLRRTSPDLWNSNFLNDLKGYLSIYGLGSTDSTKVFKANHYFKNSKDPFSFNIGPEYDDVLVELCLAPTIMSNNEKIFDDFVKKIEEKYTD